MSFWFKKIKHFCGDLFGPAMNIDLLHNIGEKKPKKSYGDYEINYPFMERNK
jgi:hypothetical protein